VPCVVLPPAKWSLPVPWNAARDVRPAVRDHTSGARLGTSSYRICHSNVPSAKDIVSTRPPGVQARGAPAAGWPGWTDLAHLFRFAKQRPDLARSVPFAACHRAVAP